MKEQSYKVLQHLQSNKGKRLTALEVAEATGISKRMVDAIFSSAIVKNGLGHRESLNGKNYLVLSPAGFEYKQ